MALATSLSTEKISVSLRSKMSYLNVRIVGCPLIPAMRLRAHRVADLFTLPSKYGRRQVSPGDLGQVSRRAFA